MTNGPQIEAWDGEVGERWVADADRYDRLCEGFGRAIIDALAPDPGERVLDIGCGNGAVALEVAGAVGEEGSVVGLDVSGPMLEEARRRARASGLANATFVRGDAQVHDLTGPSFDAAVSRFGVMFFDDPVAAFANVRTAVRPGGRLVFACWQELLRNEWLFLPASAALAHVPLPQLEGAGGPGPFSLADPDHVRQILSGAGWVDVTLDDVERPMVVGDSVDDTVTFLRSTDMAKVLLGDADAEVSAAVWESVREALEPHRTDRGVELGGRVWLVQARR